VPGDNSQKYDFDITDIQVTEITETSASISWKTDIASTGYVYYDKGSISEANMAASTISGTSHTVTLNNLEREQNYKYKIICDADGGDKYSESSVRSFTTLADMVPPIILDIRIVTVSSSGATIQWTTNEPTTGVLYWGLNTLTANGVLYSNTVSDVHQVSISGLTYMTTYYFKITATDLSTNATTSDNSTFTTLSLPSVNFSPASIIGDADETINVKIMLNVQDLALAKFTLEYDENAIDIDSCYAGPFYNNNRGFQFIEEAGDEEGTHVVMAAWQIDYDGDIPVNTDADGYGDFATVSVKLKNMSGTHYIKFKRSIDTINDNRPFSYLGDLSGEPMEANWDSLMVQIR